MDSEKTDLIKSFHLGTPQLPIFCIIVVESCDHSCHEGIWYVNRTYSLVDNSKKRFQSFVNLFFIKKKKFSVGERESF